MEALKAQLKTLKLSSMVDGLEMRNKHALQNQISYLEFLELLVEDEFARRQSNGYQTRLRDSKLHTQKVLDAYDFSFQPELDKRLIYDLASCRFVDQKSNIILMGKPGVGKTHLAHAIGLEAIKKGKKVLFVHTNEMMEKLYSSRADGSYNYTMQKYLKPDLLILDELGFKKMPQYGMDDFFEIIRHRYENGSLIVTTNRNFEDWGALFGDKVMASAIIDRIVHHAVIVKVTGKSYRIKNLAEVQDLYKTEETTAIKRGRPKKAEGQNTNDQSGDDFENE
jgi:DNA replication protein DnaC